MTEKYNGWTNWETWNVALWISNEYPSYQQAVYLAKQAYGLDNLAESLENEFYYPTPDFDETDDLRNVNWLEIAESYQEYMGVVSPSDFAGFEDGDNVKWLCAIDTDIEYVESFDDAIDWFNGLVVDEYYNVEETLQAVKESNRPTLKGYLAGKRYIFTVVIARVVVA